jgi:hypothetical protein
MIDRVEGRRDAPTLLARGQRRERHVMAAPVDG